jgi:hypothetical protein
MFVTAGGLDDLSSSFESGKLVVEVVDARLYMLLPALAYPESMLTPASDEVWFADDVNAPD